MRAYVFINVRAGIVSEAAKALAQIPGVKSAESCWGRPDIIAQVEASHLNALGTLVLSKIQKVEGVESTETHIVIEE
jgi:DNA-binding Lrp family transcriptional regulator